MEDFNREDLELIKNEFEKNNEMLLSLINTWEFRLLEQNSETISEKRNSQNRTIKQIVGHMVDSATNNTHRIIHLQYQNSPLIYPDYASLGNNDRWIALQNYQEEDWENLVSLWKYTNLHIIHVIRNVSMSKLENMWLNGINQQVSLNTMILDYLKHIQLHLREIEELL